MDTSPTSGRLVGGMGPSRTKRIDVPKWSCDTTTRGSVVVAAPA
jgi:hypothetical protein